MTRGAALALLALASCATWPRYNTPATRTTVQSSLRLIGECDGVPVGYGSGVAISATRLITARHVAIGMSPDGCNVTFKAVTFEGVELVVIADSLGPHDSDTATMRIEGPAHFAMWARRALAEPDIGDDVVMYAGRRVYYDAPQNSFVLKRGMLSGVARMGSHEMLVLSLRCVPGNSGGGVFNDAGELVGILVMTVGEADNEYISLAVPLDEMPS